MYLWCDERDLNHHDEKIRVKKYFKKPLLKGFINTTPPHLQAKVTTVHTNRVKIRVKKFSTLTLGKIYYISNSQYYKH